MKNKLIELIKENPDLEVKFMVSGELNEDGNSWFVGEITDARVSDYIEYEDKVFDEIEDVKGMLADNLYNEETAEMSDHDYNLMIEKEFGKALLFVFLLLNKIQAQKARLQDFRA